MEHRFKLPAIPSLAAGSVGRFAQLLIFPHAFLGELDELSIWKPWIVAHLRGADHLPLPRSTKTPESDGCAKHQRDVSPTVRIRLNPSQNVAFVYFESDRGMTAPDDLLRTAAGLKELLRVAWSKLADPLLTPFDRREARNQIRQHSAELRRYLQAIEARRLREQSTERHPNAAAKKPQLRLLA